MTDIVERLNNLLEADPDPAMCELYATCKAEIERLRAENAELRLLLLRHQVASCDEESDLAEDTRAALKDTKP